MWSQTSSVVFLLIVSAAPSLSFFKYQGDLPKFHVDENGTFAKYYLKNGDVFQAISFDSSKEPAVYFPKCCPPGYAFRRTDRSCQISEKPLSGLFKLAGDVNLLNTELDCEVIIDHAVKDSDLVIDSSRNIKFNGEFLHFGEYCMDFDLSKDGYVLRSCKSVDHCAKKGAMCIKKCCPDGYMYIDRICSRDPTFGMNLESYEDIIDRFEGDIALYYEGSTCPKYQADHDNIQLTITPNGSISLNFTDVDRIDRYALEDPFYCFDGLKIGDQAIPVLLFCANTKEHIKFKISRIILLISSVFLLLTITIHLFTSKSRTLMGKVIISHCACMMVAFSTLTVVQFNPSLDELCKPVAYLILFAFTATFTWLNVMCYEIWKTFGLMKNTPPDQQRAIFIKYSIYGWTVPTLMVLLVFIFNSVRVLPDEFHPFLGETHCIVENNLADGRYGHLIFFSIPQALMLMANLGFFISTLTHYFKMKTEVAALQHSGNMHAMRKKEKIRKYDFERFMTVAKLFFVMGLSWSFEVLSAIVNFKTSSTMEVVEMVFDTINALQGLFVFIIFILNRRTLIKIYKKITCQKRKEEELSVDDSFNSIISNEDKQEMTISPVHA